MPTIKTALVTGAAARIGASIARHLHQRGLNLVIHYHSNAADAENLASELNQSRAQSAVVAQADLSGMAGVEQLATQTHTALEAWGSTLDVLVNNASRFYPTSLSEAQIDEWDDLVNSNLRGPYFLIKALAGSLQDGGGSIINILDIHSERPMQGHMIYCISKAGLNMLTMSLARELGPGIRVNGVSPGAILWPENEMSEVAKETILDRTALKRLGDPADIASAVAYLALDAPYVTGQVLNVDGGRSLNI